MTPRDLHKQLVPALVVVELRIMKFILGPIQLFLNTFAFFLLATVYAIVLYALSFGLLKDSSLGWPHCVALLLLPVIGAYTYEPTPEANKEPYTSFENALNETPDFGQIRATTQWLNMGYWTVSSQFNDALLYLTSITARMHFSRCLQRYCE